MYALGMGDSSEHYRVEAPFMHNLLKRRFVNKKGSGCQMCKPHKHKHADHRTRQDVRADVDMVQQLEDTQSWNGLLHELKEFGENLASRSGISGPS